MSISIRPSRSSPFLALLLAMLAGGPAIAQPPAVGAIGQLLACRRIAAQTPRLQCFDRTSAILAASAAKGSQPTASAGSGAMTGSSRPTADAQPTVAAPNARQNFGLSAETILAHEVAAGKRHKEITSISARVTGLSSAPDGRMLYQLDDGQVWEELQANGYAPDIKAGDRVQISRGWLDSYWLQAPSGRGCKVQRLR